MEKVITYHIDAGDGELISTDLLGGLECEGCLQNQIESRIVHMEKMNEKEAFEDGTIFEFIVRVKKIMTQKEVDELPEKY